MIITCPHCQTKYQVTYEAIGSAGRRVQCAQCHQAWNQDPTAAPRPAAAARKDKVSAESDTLFEQMAEDALDEVMEAEASAVAARSAAPQSASAPDSPAPPPPGVDAAEQQKRQQAFKKRQNAMSSSLPLARLRRAARLVGIVLLAGLIGGAWFGRVAIVERYPDLAGLYEQVGLGVNVLGLEFSDLKTLNALSGGNEVLTVSAQIVGIAPRPVPVPPVVISLLDATGSAVYEWSVSPRVPDLMAGERATFDTRLSLPPSEAVRVRLSFAGRSATTGGVSPAGSAKATHHGAGAGPAASDPAEPATTQHSAPDAHAAPAVVPTDHAAEPAHAPAPAATEHH